MNRRLIRLAILNIFLVTVFYNPVASSTNLDRRTQAPTAQTSTSPVTALAFDPSSRFLVSGSEDSTLRLWNVKNSSEIRSVVGHRMAEITGAAVTPDSKTVVTAGRDSVLRVWDFATGRASKILQGHEHAIKALALRPDGKAVAGGGEDTRILVWNTSNGKLTQTLNGHDDFVNSVAFSPDGKTLASGSNDMRVILWDIATQKPRAVLRGHADAVNAVAFSADGSIVASASDDATIRLWDARSGQALATLNGHKGVVTTLAFSPKELMLVSGSADTLVRVWDIRTRKEVRSLQGNVAGISALAFSPDGNAVASGSLDGQVRIWNPGTGKPQQILRGKRQAGTSGGATQRIVPNDTAGSSALAEGTSPFTVAPGATAAQSLANGPGGPILVITSTTNPFGGYYAEILRNEGLNAFATMDIGSVTASTLANYDVVLLSEIGLTGAQVSMFQSWVTAGGNLIAMRPDKQLSGLLGLSDASATLSNGYLLVDSSSSPGNGIVDETIQFHGTADRYTLNGASSIATLYTTASAATTHPAVTLRNTGTNGGQAAAFTYDLARSIVYTRQGNPAWDRQERDGFSPIRSDDLFYGAASGDQQTDWVDLNKAEIPQADEQQRLLVNLILEMNHDKKPFPRFWYFPRGEKAVVVMTGDDHANGGTAGRWDRYKANSPPGCSVQDWECVRGTSYIYPNTPLTNAQAAAYASEGFEVGLHVSTNCSDYTPSSIDADFSSQLITWRAKYSSVPVPTTNRTHCIAYSDWVTQPKI
jgi:WD40 repeat protein